MAVRGTKMKMDPSKPEGDKCMLMGDGGQCMRYNETQLAVNLLTLSLLMAYDEIHVLGQYCTR